MTFVYDDAGRSKSKRPKQRADCTVRALAIVTGLTYDRAFDILKDAGRKNNAGFNIERWLRKNPCAGLYFEIHKVGRKPGAKRLFRVGDLIRQLPYGRLIVSTAKHVFALTNGEFRDDVPIHYHQNRPVYSWMLAHRVKPKERLYQVTAASRPKGWTRDLVRPLMVVAAMDLPEALRLGHCFCELRKGETLGVKPI